MPSFADSIFLFVLALLLFGPKRLPVLARELGKWIGEFRRASNEFKMQMDEELRASEQVERQKQIAKMEAAAPLPPPLEEPEHPHMPRAVPELTVAEGSVFAVTPEASASPLVETESMPESLIPAAAESRDGVRPIPIAVSGELRMMPPATGLPTPRSRNGNGTGGGESSSGNDQHGASPLGGGLLEAIPEAAATEDRAFADRQTESSAHGD